jgi:hypothetical protein
MKYISSAITFAVLCGAVFGRTTPARAVGGGQRGTPPRPTASPWHGPRVFAEGIISTRDYERGGTFTPDGRAYYFVKRAPETYFAAICVSRYVNGKWGAPEVAPFSGRYADLDPFVTPDGSKLFFSSTRPAGGQARGDFDLWWVGRTAEGWGEPQRLGAPVNTTANEGYATVTRDGTLYFHSSRPGGKGGADIYRSRPVNGGYGEPENLGEAVNTQFADFHPFIAPDESFLVFASTGRPDELVGDGNRYPRGDLYVSFNEGGVWTEARRLGPRVNTAAAELCPHATPDGRYLLFTSERGFVTTLPKRRLTHGEVESGLRATLNGTGNIYQVDMRELKAAH